MQYLGGLYDKSLKIEVITVFGKGVGEVRGVLYNLFFVLLIIFLLQIRL
jgi:hypothetical protein